MKRVSALLLTCTLGLSALSGCSASAAPQPLSAQPVTISEEEMMRYDLETPAVWSALSEFGLDLLKTARQEGEGTLLSPPFPRPWHYPWPPMVLMGETLDQFREVLGDGASLEALNVSCSALMKLYGGLGAPRSAPLPTACGPTRRPYARRLCRQMLRHFRRSGVPGGPVRPSHRPRPQQLGVRPYRRHDPPDHPAALREDAAALMVNALYLKNTWATKFDPSDTVTRDFTWADGTAGALDFLQHSPAL